MANDTPDDEKVNESGAESESEGVHEHNKHRRHGYQGYPNNPDVGGAVHTGTGFGGVGSTAEGSGSEPIFTEKTDEDVAELGDEEPEK